MGERAHVGHALRACSSHRCHREDPERSEGDEAISSNSAGFRHAPRTTLGARGYGGGPLEAGRSNDEHARSARPTEAQVGGDKPRRYLEPNGSLSRASGSASCGGGRWHAPARLDWGVYPTSRPLAGEVWEALSDLHARMQAQGRSLGLLWSER